VQELAGVLARPFLRPGAMPETVQNAGFIDPEQAALQVNPHAVPQDSRDALRLEGSRREAVGDLIGHHRRGARWAGQSQRSPAGNNQQLSHGFRERLYPVSPRAFVAISR